MKKLFTVLMASCLLIGTLATGCQKKDDAKLTTHTLNEVVHSIFYAPQYVAMEKGFFEEEGIDLKVDVGYGADKSMTAVLSGNADVALCGTEAAIYVHNEGREDVPIVFAQLTQRAGNFLVGREADPDFTWDKVRGTTIIGGREGGMPEMILEYILHQNGLDPKTDVEIITNLDLSATAGAFTSGTGDYTTEFEPGATTLEMAGSGYVVASLGVDSGYVPYTVYMTTQSFLDKKPELAQGFTNAIYKGLLWCQTHSAEEIAQAIQPQFKETDLETLTNIVSRYLEQDTWIATPVFEKESLDLIQDVLEYAGTLNNRVEYEAIINRTFAEKSVSEVEK